VLLKDNMANYINQLPFIASRAVLWLPPPLPWLPLPCGYCDCRYRYHGYRCHVVTVTAATVAMWLLWLPPLVPWLPLPCGYCDCRYCYHGYRCHVVTVTAATVTMVTVAMWLLWLPLPLQWLPLPCGYCDCRYRFPKSTFSLKRFFLTLSKQTFWLVSEFVTGFDAVV